MEQPTRVKPTSKATVDVFQVVCMRILSQKPAVVRAFL
jgi:hypothetical protein